jgi:shikimate kinase
MRGGGKSSVARLLSEKLGKEYVDVDGLIEKREGMKISETVEKRGWEYFRDRESEVVDEVARGKDIVISTGGGVIERPQNMAVLKENGLLIFLSAPADVLAGRIEHDTGRPNLTAAGSTREEVEIILAERAKLYEAAADEIIHDANMTLEEKVAEVLKRLEKRRIL